MEVLIDQLTRAARRCDAAASALGNETDVDLKRRIREQVEVAQKAWSGSWIGYHARVYIEDFLPKMPAERFDREWGNTRGLSNVTAGRWTIVDRDAAKAELLARAGAVEGTQERLEADVARARGTFDLVRDEMLPTLDAVLAADTNGDTVIAGARAEIAKLEGQFSERSFVELYRPSQVISRDRAAIMEGVQVPPHLELEFWLLSLDSVASQLHSLSKKLRHVAVYLETKVKMSGKNVIRRDGKIFIGHGRSAVWRDLKDFLQDRLQLPWDEFNRESAAGLSTKERLEAMLDQAMFAFIIMTAEDEAADNKKVARANVIHEIGLFQGRLGFSRAIVMLEHGCEEFSNINGISQIRFAPGQVSSVYEEVRKVLEREKLI